MGGVLGSLITLLFSASINLFVVSVGSNIQSEKNIGIKRMIPYFLNPVTAVWTHVAFIYALPKSFPIWLIVIGRLE